MKQVNFGTRLTSTGKLMDNFNVVVYHRCTSKGGITILDEGDGYHIYIDGKEHLAVSYDTWDQELYLTEPSIMLSIKSYETWKV